MLKPPREPFFWALFSSGGMLAALVFPALAFLLWIAAPLGWVDGPSYATLAPLVANPLARLVLFVVIALALFHWAHRFRYTLYDGLQLSHLYGLIAVVCYGGATLLTAVAAWVLWKLG
jgi:fumarate reductase subunit D